MFGRILHGWFGPTIGEQLAHKDKEKPAEKGKEPEFKPILQDSRLYTSPTIEQQKAAFEAKKLLEWEPGFKKRQKAATAAHKAATKAHTAALEKREAARKVYLEKSKVAPLLPHTNPHLSKRGMEPPKLNLLGSNMFGLSKNNEVCGIPVPAKPDEVSWFNRTPEQKADLDKWNAFVAFSQAAELVEDKDKNTARKKAQEESEKADLVMRKHTDDLNLFLRNQTSPFFASGTYMDDRGLSPLLNKNIHFDHIVANLQKANTELLAIVQSTNSISQKQLAAADLHELADLTKQLQDALLVVHKNLPPNLTEQEAALTKSRSTAIDPASVAPPSDSDTKKTPPQTSALSADTLWKIDEQVKAAPPEKQSNLRIELTRKAYADFESKSTATIPGLTELNAIIQKLENFSNRMQGRPQPWARVALCITAALGIALIIAAILIACPPAALASGIATAVAATTLSPAACAVSVGTLGMFIFDASVFSIGLFARKGASLSVHHAVKEAKEYAKESQEAFDTCVKLRG